MGIGIQNTLVYRFNYLFRSLFGLIPLIAMISLWRAVYAGKPEVGGYALGEMISYYLAVMVVDALTAVNEDDWQIAGEIKDGQISQFLLKPMNYLTYRLCLFGAGRLIFSLMALLPVVGFLIWHRESLSIPADGSTWGWFALSVVLTGLLQFFMSFAMASLAFWVAEVSTFIFILFAFEYLCSGHMFPLDLLPPTIHQLLQALPFTYMMYFPVSIYLEKTTGEALINGLWIQAAWVGAAFLLARSVWSAGVRRYSAVGG